MVVGGYFTSVDGIPTNSLAVWDPQNGLFSAFPGGDGATIWRGGVRSAGYVSALYVWNGVLYIGGWFSNLNEVEAYNIASWDGVKARPLGNKGLLSDPPRFNGYDTSSVSNLIAYGGSLYATGSFTFAGSFSFYGASTDIALNNIGRWDGTQWHQLHGIGMEVSDAWLEINGGEWFNSRPVRFTNGTRQIYGADLASSRTAVQMGGNLVMGVYTANNAEITATVAHGVIAWNGTDWLVSNDSYPFFYTEDDIGWQTAVTQLYPSQDGTRVYAVGAFNTVLAGGVYSGARPTQLSWRSVAVSTDGGKTWSAFGQSLGTLPNSWDGVSAITEYQGHVYVGGQFMSTSLGVQQFARWNSTAWEQLPYPYAFPTPDSPNPTDQIKTLKTFTVRDYGCPTVLDRLLATPSTSIFAALINSTSTTVAYHLLTDPAGTRTVFAPTDAAMEGLQFASDDEVAAFVLQHIIEGAAVPYSAPTLAPTLLFSALYNTTVLLKLGETQSRPLTVSATSGGGPVVVFGLSGFANDTATVTVDTRAGACSGHYLHTVDKAFAWPLDVVSQLTRLGATEFVAALNAANLASTLSTNTGVTIFAPSNSAFNTLVPGWRSLASASLANLLNMHLVTSLPLLYKSDIGNQTIATGSSVSLQAVSTGTVVTLRSALNGTTTRSTVTSDNYFASNGVIHLIDKVLRPWRVYAYTTAYTVPSAVNGTKLSSGTISVAKDCIVQSASGTISSGWNVVSGSTQVCLHAEKRGRAGGRAGGHP